MHFPMPGSTEDSVSEAERRGRTHALAHLCICTELSKANLTLPNRVLVLRPVLAFPCCLRAVGGRQRGAVLASHQTVSVGDPSWQSSPAACCKTCLPSAALLPPCRRQSHRSSQKLLSDRRLAAALPCSPSTSCSRLHSVPCKPSRQTSLMLGGQPASRRPHCMSLWTIARARPLSGARGAAGCRVAGWCRCACLARGSPPLPWQVSAWCHTG